MKPILILLAAPALPCAMATGADSKPNIVFVLFDDMGYGEPKCYRGNTKLQTPSIDRPAAEGMRFTDAPCAAAVCTPTRYGVLTGRYPPRIGQFGVFTTYSPQIISKSRLTVAALLKQHGYETACLGKWHLGMEWDGKPRNEKSIPVGTKLLTSPNAAGFDYFYGFTHARNIGTIIEQDRVVENVAEVDNQPRMIARAVQWIEQRKEGGHRVPFPARWPDRIKAGSVCDDTICLNDLMATCAEIVGAKLPENAGEDSVRLLPDGGGIRSSFIYKTVGGDKLELFVDAPRGHKKDAKAPAIVFFHGGGFQTGSVNQFRTHSKYLADRGMVGIRVRYRLTREKGVEVKDCVEDAISAMRWVRANAGKLGVDPDRIAASGGSAGGYLSIAAGMIDFINAKTDPAGVSAKPNAMVLFNPGIGGARKDGSPDPRDPGGKYDLNKYVKPGQPPAIIFHGKEDKVVPYASAEVFTAAMKKAGNRCELVGYEGAGHSFFNQDKYYELTIAETDKFLTGLGWLEKKATQLEPTP